MESVNHLQAVGVKEYGSPQNVPYVHDYSHSHFKGSYGVVYRATRSSTRLSRSQDSVYAIKEIQAISYIDQKKVAQEINFLRQLQHPNILEFEEAYTIKASAQRPLPTIHLVTRPWAPVSLQHFIEDVVRSSGQSTMCSWFRPQELDPWPSVVRQCLSAVAYLHTQQPRPVRHKDIKPHNILLYFDPSKPDDVKVRPIIIDFGISKEHIDHATTGNTGTYEYKAPEQIRNKEPTLKSDVFSLGCCFTLIEGIMAPWPGLVDVYDAALSTASCQFANNVHLVDKAMRDLNEQQPSSDDTGKALFSTQFRDLVRRMLEQSPENRPSAPLAMKAFEDIESHLANARKTSSSKVTITELEALFSTQFRDLARRMLEQSPENRPSAPLAMKAFKDIEAHFANARKTSSSKVTITELEALLANLRTCQDWCNRYTLGAS